MIGVRVKEKRSKAKDGLNDDPMKEMRERYERAVEAERENRLKAIEDYRFVAIPGNQWDESQRKARKGRPCYEIPILRSSWRQVVNDQKKARPGIKVRPVEDGDKDGAELRQGLIRNIESRSNAERVYDKAFELLTASGFGCWRVSTAYSADDAWDQDIVIEPITDPLTSVWFDPDAKHDDCRDAEYCFVEETLSHEAFERRYPKAKAVDFESIISSRKYGDWFGEKSVRIVEYIRREPITKTLLLLSDGRTVDAEQAIQMAEQLAMEGITVVRERTVNTHKVVSSICTGAEEIEGPNDLIFDRIPVIPTYANRHFVDGTWQWCGMVRPARDPQKLANYNITTGQEALSKQHKAVPVVTVKMLEGANVKALWDSSNAVDVPYLPITPDPTMPGGPNFLSPPPVHASFVQFGQMSIDMVKMATGIYDASIGARSNETSGRAIIARQNEGDTATFDYQDALSFSIQSTGELILSALPKVYDTPRVVRVLGVDGREKQVQLYQEDQNGNKLNDLSAGKYDVTISVGASFDTQRMEFVDAIQAMSQGNPMVAAATGDLVMKAMDFHGSDEAAERLKLLLPPQIQQAMASGDNMPPEAIAAMQQAKQAMQAAQQQMAQAQQMLGEIQQEKADTEAEKAKVDAAKKEIAAEIKVAEAELAAKRAELEAAIAKFEARIAISPMDGATYPPN